MKKPSDTPESQREQLRERIIGLGERSGRKSYYPELQQRIRELEYFKTLLDQSYDIIFTFEKSSGTLTEANLACRAFLQVAAQDVSEYTVNDICPDIAAYISDPTNDSDVSQPFSNRITDIRNSSSMSLPVELSLSFYDNEGQIDGIVIARDITERLAAEAAIRDSEEKYRLLIENATDSIIVIQNNRIIYSNPRTEEIFGYTAEQLSHTPFSTVIHPDERTKAIDRYRRKIKGDSEVSSTTEYRILAKNKREILVKLNSARVIWDGCPAVLCFIHDITIQRKLEKQLQQTQKMEAIGRLAGGIAHDFNNILASIIGYTEMAIEDVDPKKEEQRSSLQEVLSAGHRAKALVTQLWSLSKRHEIELLPVHITEVVTEVLQSLQSSMPAGIRIQRDLTDEECVVLGDKAQLCQAVLNICANAIDAIVPDIGTLSIELKIIDLTEKQALFFSNISAGPHVRLMISDTGHGIDPDISDAIFTPYFTTREDSENSGIGLSAARGIIEACKGSITFSSELNKGSVFTILLPTCTAQKTVQTPTGKANPFPGGTESILFVDDEQSLVDLAKLQLSRLGYAVTIASCAEEALELVNETTVTPDLLITDLAMPGDNGFELIQNVRKKHPGVPVIMCTGFSASVTTEQLNQARIQIMLTKPVGFQQLAQTIRQVLDNR